MQFDYLFCFDFQDWLLVALTMKHWNYGVWKQDAVRPPFGVTGAGYCVCMYPGLLTLAYFCLVLMTSLLKVGKSQKVFLFSSHLLLVHQVKNPIIFCLIWSIWNEFFFENPERQNMPINIMGVFIRKKSQLFKN